MHPSNSVPFPDLRELAHLRGSRGKEAGLVFVASSSHLVASNSNLFKSH